jgi:hypothetical protein
MTPAQAYGHPKFTSDVPVQGPTDESMRAADCWYSRNVLPAQPACVDCKGSNSMGLLGEQIVFRGRAVRGFGLRAAGDPGIWDTLSGAQQEWVLQTLISLNDLIVKTTGTSCATYQSRVEPATGCFQAWFNTSNFGFTKVDGSPLVLRTDSVLDRDTLDALRTVVALHPQEFPASFPGTELPGMVEEKKLSKGAVIGIAAAGATAVGGLVYLVVTRRKRK